MPRAAAPPSLPRLALAIAGKGAFDPAPFWQGLGADQPGFPAGVSIIFAHDGALPVPMPPIAGAVQMPLAGAPVFALWGAAVASARHSDADYVAILDINSPPRSGWLAAMLRAIATGEDLYHGPVTADYAAGDRRIIGYLIEYAQFYPPVEPGMAEIAGNNVVIRTALAGQPERLRADGFFKTRLLAERPPSLPPPRRVDDAVVIHRKPFDTRPYIVRRCRHGRCYAADRATGWSLVLRLFYAASTPLLPAIRVWRIWTHARRRPAFRAAFVRHLPTIIAAETGWSAGEALGYLVGEGACRAYLD